MELLVFEGGNFAFEKGGGARVQFYCFCVSVEGGRLVLSGAVEFSQYELRVVRLRKILNIQLQHCDCGSQLFASSATIR